MKAPVFRTGREGSAAVLGPLEGSIMDVLWSAEGPQSVAQVVSDLQTQGKEISYSAVKAVLNNLVEKGHLRKGAIGKATIFQPKLSRDKFQRDVVKTIVRSLKQNFGDAAALHLVDEFASDADGLAELSRLLAARKKALK